MKKKILTCLIFAAVILPIFSEQKIRVGVLNGPSCIPAAYMMENDRIINEVPVSYEKYADVQALLPKILKGEIDIGFMPANVAAKVYSTSNKALLCCAITGNGNLALISKNKNVKRFSDLKGKTIAVAGQGATPEYMFRYLLEKNELIINEKDGVTLSFSVPTAQIVPQLISGKIDYAVVPEPFVTIAKAKSKDIDVCIDLQSEYEYFAGEGKIYPLTVMVASKKFINENRRLMELFLSAYEEAFMWTEANPIAAGKLCEKQDLGLAAGIVSSAIPRSNYTFITGEELQPKVEELLSIFLSFDASSIGNSLPAKDFYY